MFKRKKLLFMIPVAVMLMLPPPMAYANEHYKDTCYAVGISGGYAYNNTYRHYGVFSVDAYLPVTSYFEGEVNVRLSTVNVYDFGVRLQPNFKLPYGELFLGTRVQYNLYARNDIHGVSMALTAGYRMPYLSAEIGYGTRLSAFMYMSKHSTENGINEPHNMVYRVEVFARPPEAGWNISARVTNMTEYQMERMFTPIFSLRSTVDIGRHWRLRFEGSCKPVGISNLTATFYGAEGVVGAMYRF